MQRADIQNMIIRSALLPVLLIVWQLPSSAQQLYFPPPQANSSWDTEDPAALGWCTDQLPPLLTFLEDSNTKAFIVLKDGKIVIEEYFGTFTADSNWYWASAGKSLTAFLVGLAQQDGSLAIDDPTSQYLGTGWTSLAPAEEDAITIWHQLTMTSGLDDGVPNPNCTDPSCLQYLVDPGTRWAYHNAPYTLLDSVLSNATGQALNTYLFTKLTLTTGLTGLYLPLGDNNIFFSRARAMARFGLLMQGEGTWDSTPVLTDMAYYDAMITPSQSLNEAYGYLWWLNGQASYQLPGIQFEIPGPMMQDAPSDAYNALGANGQIINISPSTGLVVVRMGELPGTDFVPNFYNNDIWQYLNAVICAPAGMEGRDTPSVLLMHPNPTSEQVELRTDGVEIREVLLTGSDGRRYVVALNGGWVDVSGLAAGLYHLEAHLVDGTLRKGRLVVQR